MFKLKNIIFDILAMIALILIGYLLVGYYSWYEYIITGYPDWMSQAFRIKSLMSDGMVSWTPVWSNGVNLWRAYQYLPHYAVITLLKLIPSLSITRGMMLLAIIVTIVGRLILYSILRWGTKISTWTAFFCSLVTYTLIQQWIAFQDFTIFIATPLVPIYTYLWIKAFSNPKLFYILSAFTGLLFSLHPVLGFMASGLWGAYLLFSEEKFFSLKSLFGSILLLIGASTFIVPLLLYGYAFTNPAFTTTASLKLVLGGEYLGMGIGYLVLLVISWIIILAKALSIPKWSKALLVACSVFLVLILLGLNSYLPQLFAKMQISRGIVFLTYFLPFVFAQSLELINKHWKSKFLSGIYAGLTALLITESITVVNQYLGAPKNELFNPIANFSDNQPRGSIYLPYDSIADASYFAPNDNFRFVNSYMEYLESSPMSLNLKKQMQNDLTYTSVSMSQLKHIDNYSQVLGIEYFIFPIHSQLPNLMLNYKENDDKSIYEQVPYDNPGYVLIKQTKPINYAYIVDKSILEEKVSLNNFTKPSLHTLSLSVWNEETRNMADLINNGDLKPVNLTFENDEQLKIDLSEQDLNDKALIITQNYSPFWEIAKHKEIKLHSTSLRFIYFNLDNSLNGEITLEHHWPKYHIYVQFLPLVSFFTIISHYCLSNLVKFSIKKSHK